MIELYLIGTIIWILYCTFNNEGNGYIAGFFQGLMSGCVWPVVAVMALSDYIKDSLRKEIRREIDSERKDREAFARDE